MKSAVTGLMFSAGLMIVVMGSGLIPQASAQRPTTLAELERAVAGDGLIALSCQTGESAQQLTIIDPKTRVMSVYHVDRATGAIALKSVRNFHWDLLMEEFNGVNPSPREIRSMLEQR